MTIAILKNTLELVHAKVISDFDMSSTTFDGKPLFRVGRTPRSEMPQLKGFPRKNSVAALLERDHNGKVCVANEFLNYASSVLGLSMKEFTVQTTEISGYQRELVASKVAKHTLKALANGSHKKFYARYIVSDDLVLLDGHHGWASVRCFEAISGLQVNLKVMRVNCDIEGLVKAARQFTSIIGIENKEGV